MCAKRCVFEFIHGFVQPKVKMSVYFYIYRSSDDSNGLICMSLYVYIYAYKYVHTSKSHTRLIGMCINVYLCAYECVNITDTHSLKYILSLPFYLSFWLTVSVSLTCCISGDLYHSLSFPLTHTYMHKHTQAASTWPTHVSKLLGFFNR